jgi:hypothetical protein
VPSKAAFLRDLGLDPAREFASLEVSPSAPEPSRGPRIALPHAEEAQPHGSI